MTAIIIVLCVCQVVSFSSLAYLLWENHYIKKTLMTVRVNLLDWSASALKVLHEVNHKIDTRQPPQVN